MSTDNLSSSVSGASDRLKRSASQILEKTDHAAAWKVTGSIAKPGTGVSSPRTSSHRAEASMQLDGSSVAKAPSDVPAKKKGKDVLELLDQTLDLEEVVQTLKADIPNLLREDPDWDIYAMDFHVRGSVEGLAVLQLLAKLLQRQGKQLVVKDEVQVNFVDGREKEVPFDPFVNAFWKIRLERPFNQFEKFLRIFTRPVSRYYRNSTQFTIEAETMFHLNKANQVDYVQIQKLVVDGRKLISWPAANVYEEPSAILQKLTTWVRDDVERLEPLSRMQRWAQGITKFDISATPIIRGWKQIASEFASPGYLEEFEDPKPKIDEAEAKMMKKMDVSQEILAQMADDIEWAEPDEILALFGEKSSNSEDPNRIFALATATEQVIYDSDGKLEEIAVKLGVKEAGATPYEDGEVPVVEIGELVAMPGRKGGVGEELLLRIARQKAGLGRLITIVPANDKLEEYYEKIGFEKIDEFGRSMVFSRPLRDETDNESLFELGSLRVA